MLLCLWVDLDVLDCLCVDKLTLLFLLVLVVNTSVVWVTLVVFVKIAFRALLPSLEFAALLTLFLDEPSNMKPVGTFGLNDITLSDMEFCLIVVVAA